jgi:hypothetical protein
MVLSIKVFEELGYFDNNRFGADSEYYYRFFNHYHPNFKFRGSNTVNQKCILIQNTKYYYHVPKILYNITNDNRDDNITKLVPLTSFQRIRYKNQYLERLNKTLKLKQNLRYDFGKCYVYLPNIQCNFILSIINQQDNLFIKSIKNILNNENVFIIKKYDNIDNVLTELDNTNHHFIVLDDEIN